MTNGCCAADHLPRRALAVYNQLVEIARREPEWRIMGALFAWDSELDGISGRHLQSLESDGWIVRLSSFMEDLPADGYIAFTHEEYASIFPSSCKQSSGRKKKPREARCSPRA